MKTDDTPDKPCAPPRLRLKLSTVGDVRAELARVYRGAKVGNIPIGDASRLANILLILTRCIESGDFETRLLALEEQQA
jgi:hypothetical protein